MPHAWKRIKVTEFIPYPEKDAPDGMVAIMLGQREDGIPYFQTIWFRSKPTLEQVVEKLRRARAAIEYFLEDESPGVPPRDFGDWFEAPLVRCEDGGVMLDEKVMLTDE